LFIHFKDIIMTNIEQHNNFNLIDLKIYDKSEIYISKNENDNSEYYLISTGLEKENLIQNVILNKINTSDFFKMPSSEFKDKYKMK
jgi:hypothetical protein